ncbi:MAG TPA: DegT/DnrJ/EryC1/StrS family aminotransferase [Anaerolineae bacterium]|nr:DegT/DnrJ/EryC1/StrS family aminotransferase [Anaerolineae bacterium]
MTTSSIGSGADTQLPVIPPENLTRWHAAIADQLREAFEAVLPVGKYTLGQQLAAFEEEFAAYSDSRHGIGISSGTAALHLALRALGVGPGDEVITVPNTYIATVFAITYTGATPVLVDVDPATWNMDAARVASALSERTKVILPVHMYGLCVDVDAVRAAAPGVPILEDAAHAHGATLAGRKAGSLGELAAFSFYPAKLLGALGDGGFITTSDDELATRVRQLRYMGQAGTKHEHLVLGYQERLDEMQAAFLRIKLRQIDDQLAGRRRVAARYHELLADTPLQLPAHDATGLHAYYQYTVLAPRREELQAFLERRNIQTQIMYPKLVPDQGAYQTNPWRAADDLAVARSLVPRVLCLPMFAELTDDEVERVGSAVREFYGG